MKVHVEHDEHGNIHAVAVPAGGSAKTGLMAGPGRYVSEVEAPEVQHAQDHENLSKIRKHYRIEGHRGKPSLARKSGA
jgi:hypothetical protein